MAKNKNMIILGIHDGHNASATLLKDGKLICSIAWANYMRSLYENPCRISHENAPTIPTPINWIIN